MGKVKEYYYEMNILDLNEDIMGKIKHKLFLKQLIKHRQDNFYKVFKTSLKEWNKYESDNKFNLIALEDGMWGLSFDPDEYFGETRYFVEYTVPKYEHLQLLADD